MSYCSGTDFVSALNRNCAAVMVMLHQIDIALISNETVIGLRISISILCLRRHDSPHLQHLTEKSILSMVTRNNN